MTPTLIYCAARDLRMAEIAIRYGFLYGAQLPNKIYFHPEFVDQNWKAPVRDKYMQALQTYRPALATVLDLERPDQLREVLSWAQEAAQYVSEAVIIIPKYFGAIADLPREVNGKQVRLGYSVPTEFAGTQVPVWEFFGWPVHLLGGSPNKQLELSAMLNVQSADGNYAAKMARRYNQFYANGTARYAKNRYWPQLQEASLGFLELGNYHSFVLSCINIRAAWRGNTATIRYATEVDIPAVKKIANQYRNELGFVMIPALKEAIARLELYVAVMGQQVVGFVNFRTRRDGWHTVYEIAVHRDWKGQGIGSALLNAILDPVRLKCTVDNPANNFYEKEGFTLVRTEDGRTRRLNVWERNFVPMLRRLEDSKPRQLRDQQAPRRRKSAVPKDVQVVPQRQTQPVLFEMPDSTSEAE